MRRKKRRIVAEEDVDNRDAEVDEDRSAKAVLEEGGDKAADEGGDEVAGEDEVAGKTPPAGDGLLPTSGLTSFLVPRRTGAAFAKRKCPRSGKAPGASGII